MLKPYDLWKQGSKVVTQQETVFTKQNREIKMKYDDCDKTHLTKMPETQKEYTSTNDVYHSSSAPVPKDHRDIDENVHRFMKKPNVAIGKGDAETKTS